ncbi:MAG: hypothetical protein IKT52_14735 [Oscillospiraceae bacterium]|nr:hypothetical protein [Oscillospiraceae bacterium]
MSLTYRTKRRLYRAGLIGTIVLLAAILVGFCWVIWLERYVVYTGEGATLNFELSASPGAGQIAMPPSAGETVPIYVNEGLDAIDLNRDLTQLKGYYIDGDTLQSDVQGARDIVAKLPSNTAVMVELKSIWGQFNYTSKISNVTISNRVDTIAVDKLITDITSRNLYAVAVIPAFRDRYFFLINNSNTSMGLAVPRKGYLWQDDESCYWFDPTDPDTISRLQSIVDELKSLGFDEVVFSEFRIPNTDNINFKDDRTEAIKKAAQTLVTSCATDNFAVSFLVSDSNFPVPEGRSRLFMENVGPKNVGAVVAKLNFVNPEARLVFLSTTNDTRYDDFGVLRPITMASSN